MLLELFDDESRPSLRWLREQQKRRVVPYVRIGRLIFFCPEQVRLALNASRTMRARSVKHAAPQSKEAV